MVTIKLPVKLDISAVADYYFQVLFSLSESDQQHVQIDASELTHVDTAGIQLLLALVQQLPKEKKTLSWQSTPDVLIQHAEQLGLTDALHI